MPVCPECGERHDPSIGEIFNGAICDLQTEKSKRIEADCPYHKARTAGTRRFYYDTTRDFLDCGVTLDHGYGYYQLSDELEAEERHEKRARAKARRAARMAVTA